jgi:hypothetical protein
MQNADKSNIRNLTDINSREPSDSRYCQENQNGQSSKSKRGISEEGEKSVQSIADDRGPKAVRSKSEGNVRSFEDKNDKLREKAVNIGVNCLRLDQSTLREDSGYRKEKFQMGKYCIVLQEENQSSFKTVER